MPWTPRGGVEYSFALSALDWVGGQRHALAALYLRERDPVPII
jgi:hypothetical protein